MRPTLGMTWDRRPSARTAGSLEAQRRRSRRAAWIIVSFVVAAFLIRAGLTSSEADSGGPRDLLVVSTSLLAGFACGWLLGRSHRHVWDPESQQNPGRVQMGRAVQVLLLVSPAVVLVAMQLIAGGSRTAADVIALVAGAVMMFMAGGAIGLTSGKPRR